MQRRFLKVGVAAAVLVLVSSGSYAAASAGNSPAVSQAASIGACATASGYLRLVDSSAKCPTGYTSIKVAQAATTAKQGSLTCGSDNAKASKTVVTPGGDVITSSCDNSVGCSVKIVPGGSQSIEIGGSVIRSTYDGQGTSYVQDLSDGYKTTIPDGTMAAADQYPDGARYFVGGAADYGVHVALHLIASRAGGSFAVDVIFDCAAGGGTIGLQVTPST